MKLISAYTSHANDQQALLVFHHYHSNPNLIAWNSILKSLSSHNKWTQTLHYFNTLLLLDSSISPDEYTFTSVLKACAGLLVTKKGEKTHGMVLRRGHHSNLFIMNSLVDMYFKFRQVRVARLLFDEMCVKDVVSWNTLISGYCSTGDVIGARELFDVMVERSIVSWSAMIAGYTHSGDLDKARDLFDKMPERNVICWNAMIAGYAQNERYSDAIRLFREMQRPVESGRILTPNDVTLVCVLSACAHLGALDLGKWVHGFIKRKKMELNLFLGNALCDMYAKSGCIAEAKEIFHRMIHKDVVSWSIIISGLAMHGKAKEALVCFSDMRSMGINPNDITFLGVLSACTHAGLVEDGIRYFDLMCLEFEIPPKVEHYGCMVDLLSRAGRLEEAEGMIQTMKVAPNVVVWGALLGGCRIHSDIDRGQRVVERILELDPEHPGSYVYLYNAYSSAGRLEDAAACRLKMRSRQVVKTPACSWIEVNTTVYEFFMGDRSHPRIEQILEATRELSGKLRVVGYRPDTSVVSQSIDEEEKENALSMHSEKLAFAFGLISTSEGTLIRIVKNLRVCNDCHDWMKLASTAVNREIILRDRSRFHHFKDGSCSCNDYW